MLKIDIQKQTVWDEVKEEFYHVEEGFVLCLEHSLYSISKWESKWCKPFVNTTSRTPEEVLYYIKCMTVNNEEVPDYIYSMLTEDDYRKIEEYVENPCSAYKNNNPFSKIKTNRPSNMNRDTITSEYIYYCMISLNIPMECDKWNFNRLMNLIEICNIKNTNPENIPKSEMASRRAEINAQRRKMLHSRG